MTNPQRVRTRATAIAALCFLTLPLRAQTPVLEGAQVASMAIARFDATGIDLRIGLTGTARAAVTLTDLMVDDLTVSGIPLVARPVPGPVTLKRDEAIQGLDNLTVRVNFDDVPSLAPLQNIARSGHARLQATIRGTPALNVLARLLLRGRTAVVVARVDQDVAVAMPGGRAGQLALQGTLAVAESFWGVGRRFTTSASTGDILDSRDDVAVVALETHYRLRVGDGTFKEMERITSGFLLDDRTVLATAESVEPWLFDPVVAAALRDGSVQFVDHSRQIRLSGSSPHDDRLHDASETARGSDPRVLRVMKVLDDRVQAITHPTRRRFELRLRDSHGNAALLALPTSGGRVARRADLREGGGWQPVTIPRVTGQATRSLRTFVRWNGRRYDIRDRVDRDRFGAPIVTENGIVGMVQDERSGVPLNDVLSRLG